MLDAIHKNTKQGYSAYQIWSIFKNPYEEEFYCCPDCQKKVIPVKGHIRKETINVISFFRLDDPAAGGCIHGESDEHKKAKILIASLIENEKIKLEINKTTIPYHSLKIKEVPHLPWRWEQTVKDRRADILFRFSEWHPLLGLGLVLEIQISNLDEEKRSQRTQDWISQGYSITWIEGEDIEEDNLKTEEIIVQHPYTSELNALIESKIDRLDEKIEESKETIEEIRRTSLEEIEEYTNLGKSCRTCIHANWDRTKDKKIISYNYLNCWEKYENYRKKGPEHVELLGRCCYWKKRDTNKSTNNTDQIN
jgi:competence CoiA-like predicted nuclease